MKFTLEHGKSICVIAMNSICSYLKFNTPVSVAWSDCRGSVAEYLAVLPYSFEYREAVNTRIESSLYHDFSEDLGFLYEVLKPLILIFQNGEYELNFHSSNDNSHFNDEFYLAFSKSIDLVNQSQIRTSFKSAKRDQIVEDILDYSTSSYYPYDGHNLFATLPKEKVDSERVLFFEKEIVEGRRPFAIILNAESVEMNLTSHFFILDGHHKLLAYENLNISPAYALLTFHCGESVDFDLEPLKSSLYPWQSTHIISNSGK